MVDLQPHCDAAVQPLHLSGLMGMDQQSLRGTGRGAHGGTACAGTLIYWTAEAAHVKQAKNQPHPGIKALPVQKRCLTWGWNLILDYLGQQ